MIGDIIEIARAKASLGDVTHLSDAEGARRRYGISGHKRIDADLGNEWAEAGRWSWASLARTAARLLQAY